MIAIPPDRLSNRPPAWLRPGGMVRRHDPPELPGSVGASHSSSTDSNIFNHHHSIHRMNPHTVLSSMIAIPPDRIERSARLNCEQASWRTEPSIPGGFMHCSAFVHLTFNHHHSIHRMIKSHIQLFLYDCDPSRSLIEPSIYRGCDDAYYLKAPERCVAN